MDAWEVRLKRSLGTDADEDVLGERAGERQSKNPPCKVQDGRPEEDMLAQTQEQGEWKQIMRLFSNCGNKAERKCQSRWTAKQTRAARVDMPIDGARV